MSDEELAQLELETSLLTFGEEILGYRFYGWQCNAIEPFDHASLELVQVSLATPNGSGKSAVVIPTLVLGWLALYPKGKVVLTTADGKQLDGQVMPAIEAHRAKFPDWKFIEREITTRTGGRFVAFTTDQAGRAEGWHKIDNLDGPLLIICDEAKTIPDDIFGAIDRCTYNAILLTSSPGHMVGRFYESQFVTPGFVRIRVGLNDCPHITQDKIDRIMAQYGPNGATPNEAFIGSTLEGKFMEASGEARFDRDGLKELEEQAKAEDERQWLQQPHRAELFDIIEQDNGQLQLRPNPVNGWAWIKEHPAWTAPPYQGPSYPVSVLGFCDPMTGEQSEGSLDRDTHAAGILRAGYIDELRVEHDHELVAVLHHEGGCRWDNDVLAERLSLLLRYYGDAPVIVEANNSGTEVMRLLLIAGRTLWRREKVNHKVPGRKMIDVVGFQTNGTTKNIWIGAIGTVIRERTLGCCYRMAVEHMKNFILNEKGTGEAQAGCKDDFVTGIGLALFALSFAKQLKPPQPLRLGVPVTAVRGPWG